MLIFSEDTPKREPPIIFITLKGEKLISKSITLQRMDPEQLIKKLETACDSLRAVYNVDTQQLALDALNLQANKGDGNIKLYEKLGRLQAEIQRYRELCHSVNFARDYLQFASELKDQEAIESSIPEADEALANARNFIVGRKFIGSHDEAPALITLRSGVGGTSLEPYLHAFGAAYARFSYRHGLAPQEIEKMDDTELTLNLSGRHSYAWLRGEDGLHRIIYDAPNGSRQTGYVSVTVEPIIAPVKVQVKDADIRAEFIGASTPGGQHANKSLTGVRLTHTPTGITATSRMRSQAQNIKAARTVLESRVELHYEQDCSKADERRPLGRGHHFRSYGFSGPKFISDHRTNVKVQDPTSFFQGNIEPFVFGFYKVDLF